jgi:hypothetical protein
VKQQDGRSGKGDAAFRGHLAVYICVGLFLLTLNLLTSPGELWFYWPLFFWGWALIFQAVATYGAETPQRVADVIRSFLPASSPVREAAEMTPPATPSLDAIDERIQRLWRIARKIPKPAVRDQAFRICAAADRIAEVMANDRSDMRTIAWFNERLLEPAESLLASYVRLSSRGVAGAEETLRRVEEQNLPQIESRLDLLYDQLHRGEVVDLAVASEMLDFELPDALPVSLRSRS